MFGKGQRNYFKPQGTRRKGKRKSKSLNISQLKHSPQPIAHLESGTRRLLDQDSFRGGAAGLGGGGEYLLFLHIRILVQERRELEDDKALTTGSGRDF